MAFPAPVVEGVTPTWAKTANTFKRDVDAKLWPALQAKHPILDMMSRPPVSNFKFEWEVDIEPTRLYTAKGSDGDTNIDNHATNQVIVMTTSVADLQLGTILRNASRPTTVGSYGMDELLEVTGIDGAKVTVNRDVGNQNAGSGSLLQCYDGAANANDVYEVVYVPVPEGSGPGVNRYKDVTLVDNYANSVDFYLTVTGDQLATDRLIAADNMANQFQKNLTTLSNQLEGMFFYGALNNSAPAGTAQYVRRTKGFDYWVAAAGGNYDVTTRKVTPKALDNLFYQILADNTDATDTFIIATHPMHARTISGFGIDKVRLGQEESKYGRYIDTFKSDLGVEAKVIWSLNISKSDLFIIDMNKVSMPTFRPFETAEWTYGDDGVDAYRQRILGSFGVKVVDGLYSHAKLGLLW